MSSLPIADYALLSDRHSAALVSTGDSIDWLCMPRFGNASIFDAQHLDDRATITRGRGVRSQLNKPSR